MIYIAMYFLKERTIAELRAKDNLKFELQEWYEQIAKPAGLFPAFHIPDQVL